MSETQTIKDPELMKSYELGFHIVPANGAEAAQKSFDEVKQLIAKTAEITSESSPALLSLKYTMTISIDSKNQRYNTAYFAWVRFDTTGEEVESIKEDLDLRSDLVRYILIKSDTDETKGAEAVAQILSDDEEDEVVDTRKSSRKTEAPTEAKEAVAETEEKTEDSTEEVTEEVAETPEAEAPKSETDEKIDKAIDDLVEEEK